MKTTGMIAFGRQRTYGRRLCQGIVDYARADTDGTLRIVEFDKLERASCVADCDGFIARGRRPPGRSALSRWSQVRDSNPRPAHYE